MTARDMERELRELGEKGRAEKWWKDDEPVDARELLDILIIYFDELADEEENNGEG